MAIIKSYVHQCKDKEDRALNLGTLAGNVDERTNHLITRANQNPVYRYHVTYLQFILKSMLLHIAEPQEK